MKMLAISETRHHIFSSPSPSPLPDPVSTMADAKP